MDSVGFRARLVFATVRSGYVTLSDTRRETTKCERNEFLSFNQWNNDRSSFKGNDGKWCLRILGVSIDSNWRFPTVLVLVSQRVASPARLTVWETIFHACTTFGTLFFFVSTPSQHPFNGAVSFSHGKSVLIICLPPGLPIIDRSIYLRVIEYTINSVPYLRLFKFQSMK